MTTTLNTLRNVPHPFHLSSKQWCERARDTLRELDAKLEMDAIGDAVDDLNNALAVAARTVKIDPAIFSAVRRALDYSVSRMHLDENEKSGLRALSDDILSIELSGRQNVPAAPILEDSQGVSRAESAEANAERLDACDAGERAR